MSRIVAIVPMAAFVMFLGMSASVIGQIPDCYQRYGVAHVMVDIGFAGVLSLFTLALGAFTIAILAMGAPWTWETYK